MLSKNPDNMEQIKSNFAGKTIYCGLDVHKNSWNLGIHLDDVFLRNVHQKPNPKTLIDFLQKNYQGATYKTAYEAGKFGRFDASILDS
jgi:transposase